MTNNKNLTELHGLLYAINGYHTDHLRRLYQRFDHDLDLCLVLAEISRYNTRRIIIDKSIKSVNRNEIVDSLKGCNAYSISTSTGMPSQTVRRKIKKLLDLGWIQLDENKKITITSQVNVEFEEFQKETLKLFIELEQYIGQDIRQLY